jgi:hypothetical protein
MIIIVMRRNECYRKCRKKKKKKRKFRTNNASPAVGMPSLAFSFAFSKIVVGLR